jgi:hypothetical protein
MGPLLAFCKKSVAPIYKRVASGEKEYSSSVIMHLTVLMWETVVCSEGVASGEEENLALIIREKKFVLYKKHLTYCVQIIPYST